MSPRQNFRLPLTDQLVLERWLRSPKTPQRLALRTRIVLALAQGISGREAANTLEISRHTVDLWRSRYLAGGTEALRRDKPGRGRKAKHEAAIADRA